MRKHGNYRIERYGEVILSVVVDAWNLETMLAYSADFRSFFETTSPVPPWGLIVDAREWRLATPEVGPELGRLARWKDRNGLVAAAYINLTDDDLKATFAADQIFRHYSEAQLSLVPGPREAMTWVKAHGFEIEPGLCERLTGSAQIGASRNS